MATNITINGTFDDEVKINTPLDITNDNGADDITVNDETLTQLVERLGGGAVSGTKAKLRYCGDHFVFVSPEGVDEYYFKDTTEVLEKVDLSTVGEIILEEDYTITSQITVSNDVVINLNNHKIIQNNTTSPFYSANITNGANVVVKNGSASMYKYGAMVSNGTLTLKNFNITIDCGGSASRAFNVATSNQDHQCAFLMDSKSSIVMNNAYDSLAIFLKSVYTKELTDPTKASKQCYAVIDGKIEINCTDTDVEHYSYGLCDNGSTSPVGVKWIINKNANISCSNGVGIHHAADGELILNGGKITGTMSGITCRAGKLYAPSYSTVEVKGIGTHYQYQCGHFGGAGASTFWTGDGITFEVNTGYSEGNLSADILGGTYASVNGNPIGSYRHTVAANASFYTENDFNNGIKLNNGEYGEVGKLYAIVGNTASTDRSQWVWDSTVITGEDSNFMRRLTSFVDMTNVTLSSPIATDAYENLTGNNASYSIAK